MRGFTRNIQHLRAIAYRQQRGRCVWCDSFVPEREATAEHLKPQRKGGLHTRGNVVMACAPCNVARSIVPISESTWVWRSAPHGGHWRWVRLRETPWPR